ncbi:MAG: 1-(5-phosphoribosyl)-5-[(5-phosphoribosylamino)methylideneamino]imidazole-4-carboxamide isomerase [Spirochaetes bacterium]|nr:1-(5-phosphoribosyl)-5-[(5-phosphoribosylamino)methylideneamino]imidazole-4-carboxamide isomerase [Spirochaetota bacterium]
MFIIPAIDLIQGKCVRLTEGDFNRKKEYENDPLNVANYFKKIGAKRIHIVDLDGASTGNSVNREIIKNIKKETGLIIQTGGGIRTENDIKELIDGGIDYLILGTILVENFQLVERWLQKYGDIFLASIDVKRNMLQTRGWTKDEGIDAITFGKNIFKAGFKTAIYTDIARDGMLAGPNLEDTKNFGYKTKMNVILSGGISSNKDIIEARSLADYGVIGLIIGKAYYEGRIDLQEVIKEYQD